MYDELVKRLREAAKYDPEYVPCIIHREDAIEAADAIEELSMKLHGDEATILGMKREIERMVVNGTHRWIPVEESLPESGKRYLVIRYDYVTNTSFIDILWYDAHDLWWNRMYKGDYNVTHWMPLPQPLEGET